MKVRGFNHLAIQTLDLEASIHFYRDVLGLIQDDTVDSGESSSTNFFVPDGSFVELLCTRAPRSAGAGSTVDHIAFDVDDVEAAERALRQLDDLAEIAAPSGVESLVAARDITLTSSKPKKTGSL